MVKITQLAESLDWPTEPLEEVAIQCAGKAYLDYQALVMNLGENDSDWERLFLEEDALEEEEEDGATHDQKVEEYAPASIDLFSLSEEDLEAVDYYKVLHLPYWPNLTKDDIKKAYRKACLKYHPDKSGRDEEDAVFLKVKAAFETLSTNKQAYDSTEMPFDDSIPDQDADEFFKDFGSAFERNLFFDARLLPGAKAKKGKNRRNRSTPLSKPPNLGDSDTTVDKVHEFYDYWTHFETWRDFGLQAARELETEDHVENAESRYEKRWYQKQIDTHAKKLKQKEQQRITLLVERAMAVDPRLLEEKRRIRQEKEDRKRQREQEALEKQQREEEARVAEERRLEEEKQKKAEEKLLREKEKKLLRKTKQVFRKLVGDSLSELLEPEHSMDDEVDLICAELDRDQLLKLNSNLESKTKPGERLALVKRRSVNLKESKTAENGGTNGASKPKVVKIVSTTVEKVPFTQKELSTLAKAVKKYPAGGANRWDQIALYINNVCRPETPRTKEECIETFNQNKVQKPTTVKPPTEAEPSAPTPDTGDDWTEEQDKLLQEGLSKYPASMDKNERWASIAGCIPGKSKKQCVQRFKAIRDAIKNRK